MVLNLLGEIDSCRHLFLNLLNGADKAILVLNPQSNTNAFSRSVLNHWPLIRRRSSAEYEEVATTIRPRRLRRWSNRARPISASRVSPTALARPGDCWRAVD